MGHVTMHSCVHTLVFDAGSLFSPEILDIKDEDLISKFVAVCVGCG